jgi:opacity protein-like surface antigen
MLKRYAVAALMMLVATAPAIAQSRVQVTPFYGYLYPQGELPERFAIDRANGSLDISEGEFEDRTPMYGATVAVGVWKWLAIEGTFLTGTDKLAAARREPVDVQVMAYSAGVGIELPRYGRVEPFLLGGIGVKSYDFDIDDTQAEKDLEYNIGAGVNIEVLPNFALNVQARDFMSTFSSSLFDVADEKQNDLFIAAGFTLRFNLKPDSHAVVKR